MPGQRSAETYLRLELLDLAGDHAPHHEVALARDLDARERFVSWLEPHAPGFTAQALDRELAVQAGHHDVAAVRFHRAVDDEQVAVDDVRALHALARSPDQEGGQRVLDEHLVEVNLAFEVIIRRRRETRAHAAAHQLERYA